MFEDKKASEEKGIYTEEESKGPTYTECKA
jgi:hypothetical protein